MSNKFLWYSKRAISYVMRPRVVVQERAVIVDDRNICENPIFLIGVFRSGTSLVRRMFNSHSKIACPPETFYLPHYAAMLQDPMTMSGYEGFGYSEEEMRVDISRVASHLHEAYRISQDKPRWADKTPQYVWHLDSLDKMYGGNARFVMIRRHPFDIAFSITSRGWKFNDIEDIFESNLVYVRDSISKMEEFRTKNSSKCVDLSYQSLTANPTAELTRVLRFLGEEFEPSMLDYHKKNHNVGLEDPMVRGTKGIKKSAENWRSWSAEEKERARAILGPTAEVLGYKIE